MFPITPAPQSAFLKDKMEELNPGAQKRFREAVAAAAAAAEASKKTRKPKKDN
jgi:hypothetical protein